MSEPTIEQMLSFVADRLASGEPHRHHRACIHNLSYDEQYALRKRRGDGTVWTDEEMKILKLDRHIITITPDDWEIEPPWDKEESRE